MPARVTIVFSFITIGGGFIKWHRCYWYKCPFVKEKKNKQKNAYYYYYRSSIIASATFYRAVSVSVRPRATSGGGKTSRKISAARFAFNRKMAVCDATMYLGLKKRRELRDGVTGSGLWFKASYKESFMGRETLEGATHAFVSLKNAKI